MVERMSVGVGCIERRVGVGLVVVFMSSELFSDGMAFRDTYCVHRTIHILITLELLSPP